MDLGTEKDISDKTEEIKINPKIVIDCTNINALVLTNVVTEDVYTEEVR